MKQKIRHLLCCILIASCLITITAFADPPPWPSDTGIAAESGVVIDADSGALLFGQNSVDAAYPPASITKILTALVVLEHCQLDEIVTFSETAMNSVEADSGNKLSLTAGDQLSVEDCLYSLLLFSVNQSANALAEHVAGSMPAFVDMMNEKASQLGCSDKTHFENPSGLNGDTQNVTAYDMALIAQAAYNNEELLKISSSLNHKINSTINNPDGISFRHEHRLVYTTDPGSEFYYPPAIAGKTGYLQKAGNTLVTYAENDGRRLISVVLKGSRPQYFIDGKTLLEFGFSRFKNVTIADSETRYVTGNDKIQLNGISYNPSDLMIEPDRVITLPGNARIEDAVIALEELPAEHPAEALAVLRYSYNDRFIGKAFLMVRNPSVEIPSSSISDNGAPDSEYGQPTTPDEAEQPDNNKSFSFHLPKAGILAVSLGLSIGVLLIFTTAWMFYSQRKEAQELAARRELRRRRLQAHGEEAEFERLMAMRKNRETIQRPSRTEYSVKTKKSEKPESTRSLDRIKRSEKNGKPKKTMEDAKITDNFSDDFDGFDDFDDFSG
ncbi:MAG: D-alanyl-D-alanine carboxypeptidase [Lachnospiraceae bacterium]|nr:D-alanyl-D-alanine carboxypeptidase [Lachnospiraceae bacterium]